MSRFEERTTVDVPVSVAYDGWTRFEDFPSFMAGVASLVDSCDPALQPVVEGSTPRRRRARLPR